MKMLALEDLSGMTEKQIIEHLATQYSGVYQGSSGDAKDISEAKKLLKPMKVLLAYESVGNWGCDSSSYFLLQNKKTKKLFEIHGSHCSCYGFEGQLSLEETNIPYLKKKTEGGSFLSTGGYDSNES